MLRKYYNNNTLSTHRPTQKGATCEVVSAKTKSIWQTSLSKLNNSFCGVRVKKAADFLIKNAWLHKEKKCEQSLYMDTKLSP